MVCGPLDQPVTQPRQKNRRPFFACLVAFALVGALTQIMPSNAAPTRDPVLWPFAASDPFNMPLGDGATFGGSHPIPQGWLNYDQYSVPVCYASNSDPLVTINASSGSYPGDHTYHIPTSCQPAAPNGGDMHMVVISPDRTSSDETWFTQYSGNSGTAGVYLHVDLQGPGVGLGWARATGVSLLAGLIRSQEVASGSIPHALAFSAPAGMTGSASYVWPAISSDGAGEGALVAIPSGVAKPAGLSPLSSAIFDALQHYGAYNVDTAGGGAANLFVEPSADGGQVNASRNDITQVMALTQIVTNNGPSSVGGPGNRLAPLAPDFGGAPSTTVGSTTTTTVGVPATTPPPVTTSPPTSTLPSSTTTTTRPVTTTTVDNDDETTTTTPPTTTRPPVANRWTCTQRGNQLTCVPA